MNTTVNLKDTFLHSALIIHTLDHGLKLFKHRRIFAPHTLPKPFVALKGVSEIPTKGLLSVTILFIHTTPTLYMYIPNIYSLLAITVFHNIPIK